MQKMLLSSILTVVVQENKSPKKSHSVHRRRHLSATEREEQERIDRENRILLRKILEQHHGLRRSSSIPPPQAASRKNDLKKQRQIDLNWKISKQTSNQVKNLVKQWGLGRCPSHCKLASRGGVPVQVGWTKDKLRFCPVEIELVHSVKTRAPKKLKMRVPKKGGPCLINKGGLKIWVTSSDEGSWTDGSLWGWLGSHLGILA